VLVDGFDGALTDGQIQQAFDDINHFERALADDRYAVIKFFLHIDRDEQRRRLEELAADETTSWRVESSDWEENERYDEHLGVMEELLARTESEWAPWHVVACHDLRRARIDVIETVIERVAAALADRGLDHRRRDGG
jgi:polyphosphate kinase 2 (PPK2 family)